MKDVLGFLVMCLIAVFVVPPILEAVFTGWLGLFALCFLLWAFTYQYQ